MSARFEIVRTGGDGISMWHARFRARNGQIVWVTESYTRRRAARRAVDLLAEHVGYWIATRDIDERTP